MARAATRRDQLIDTALALFAREGYHATGIDRILSEAGPDKTTHNTHEREPDSGHDKAYLPKPSVAPFLHGMSTHQAGQHER